MLLRLNKKIYSEPVIKKAIKDFTSLADFEVNQNKKYFLVKTIKIRSELRKDFQDEFSNYVLSLMKK